MNLQDYLKKRIEQAQQKTKIRKLCCSCLQPEFSCYCPYIEKFDPKIKFVILIHPIEVRRRIATGRMAHLSLENSHLIMGQNYTANVEVNNILSDPANQCLVLYPGRESTNISLHTIEERRQLMSPSKNLVIFVIDGTWATAGKMIRQSTNLFSLPRICFSLETRSQFLVRKQPAAHCFSTIEAIHHVIELLSPIVAPNVACRRHDSLLDTLDRMVQTQLSFIKRAHENSEYCHYRRETRRI